MAETNTGVARAPIASVAKSSDPNLVRWAVSAQKHQTEWFKSEAQAIKKADALCRAAGSITWTEYAAARALHKRQVEALPELLELARIYAQLHDGLSNMIESGRLTEKEIPDDYLWLCDSLQKAVIANYAVEEKGVKL